jgi:hypothetical protein
VTYLYVADDGEGEPTVWSGDKAVVRRCDLAYPDAWDELREALLIAAATRVVFPGFRQGPR